MSHQPWNQAQKFYLKQNVKELRTDTSFKHFYFQCGWIDFNISISLKHFHFYKIKTFAFHFILITFRQSVRDELINIRSNEPDEGITGTGRYSQRNLMKHFWCKAFWKVIIFILTTFNSATPTLEKSPGLTKNMKELSSWIMRRSWRQNLVIIQNECFYDEPSYVTKSSKRLRKWKFVCCSGKPKARDPLPSVPPPTTTRRRQRRFRWTFLFQTELADSIKLFFI